MRGNILLSSSLLSPLPPCVEKIHFKSNANGYFDLIRLLSVANTEENIFLKLELLLETVISYIVSDPAQQKGLASEKTKKGPIGVYQPQLSRLYKDHSMVLGNRIRAVSTRAQEADSFG